MSQRRIIKTKKMNKTYNRKENSERKKKEFWIDTYGKIHKFKGDLSQEYTSLHAEIVYSLFPDKLRPEKYVDDLGWVKVASVVYGVPICYREPTQAQMNTLFDLGLFEKLHIEKNGYFVKNADQLEK